MQYTTKSEKELIKLGKKLAKDFKAGDIVLLKGNLGAGKTTITKGMAKYFNIKQNITSPTFSLMNIYEVKNPEIKSLIHIDTYRLKDENDLIEIGVEDYLGTPNTICIIEWPEKIKSLLKNKQVIKIKIEHLDEGRKIMIN